jgi:hypothetical protein
MTREEFLDKLESEGEAYAFQDYGLHEDMLDDSVSDAFRTAARNARVAYENAKVMGGRLYFA